MEQGISSPSEVPVREEANLKQMVVTVRVGDLSINDCFTYPFSEVILGLFIFFHQIDMFYPL